MDQQPIQAWSGSVAKCSEQGPTLSPATMAQTAVSQRGSEIDSGRHLIFLGPIGRFVLRPTSLWEIRPPICLATLWDRNSLLTHPVTGGFYIKAFNVPFSRVQGASEVYLG